MKVGEFYKYKAEGVGYHDAEVIAIDGDWVVVKYLTRTSLPYTGQPITQKIVYFLM